MTKYRSARAQNSNSKITMVRLSKIFHSPPREQWQDRISTSLKVQSKLLSQLAQLKLQLVSDKAS